MESVSTLQNHEITNHKLKKQSFFYLSNYMHFCMSHFCNKKIKQNILHKHSQNMHLFFYAFSFLSFYLHTICRFCFLENTNAHSICKVIYCKQKLYLVNTFIKFLLPNFFFCWVYFPLECKRLITAKEIFLSCFS